MQAIWAKLKHSYQAIDPTQLNVFWSEWLRQTKRYRKRRASRQDFLAQFSLGLCLMGLCYIFDLLYGQLPPILDNLFPLFTMFFWLCFGGCLFTLGLLSPQLQNFILHMGTESMRCGLSAAGVAIGALWGLAPFLIQENPSQIFLIMLILFFLWLHRRGFALGLNILKCKQQLTLFAHYRIFLLFMAVVFGSAAYWALLRNIKELKAAIS